MADSKMESVRMLSFIELFMFVEIVLDRSATTPVAMAGWRKTDAKLQKRRQIIKTDEKNDVTLHVIMYNTICVARYLDHNRYTLLITNR